MKFGISEGQLKNIIQVFSEFSELKKVVLFGSRAKGTFHPGSDIDLALTFNNDVREHAAINRIYEKLEQLNLPYSFDLLAYERIKEQELIDHIDRVGIVFYGL